MCKVTIKHYFDFSKIAGTVQGHVHSAQAWDDLRLQEGASNIFAIPAERQEWQERAGRESLIQAQAKDIADIIRGRFKRANSYGAGPAFLEYFIKQQCPDIFLHCSDYTAKSIERLRRVFTEADEVVTFDMFNDPWRNADEGTLHLLYRVDTVLDDAQWRSLFGRMRLAGTRHVLFVPCEFLTARRWLGQMVKRGLWPLLGKRLSFAGYLRTKARFMDMFLGAYTVEREVELAGGVKGFLLTIKEE